MLWSNQGMDYFSYVLGIEDLYERAQGHRTPKTPAKPLKDLGIDPKRILIVAPHPDDECLMAGLALRAIVECGAMVQVLPFSFGSKIERRHERLQELEAALKVLGFELINPRVTGLDELTASELAQAMKSVKPDLVIFPHSRDAHPTHIRCSEMTKNVSAVWAKAEKIKLTCLETEYWQQMESPNLMVPLEVSQVSRMGEALLNHAGEISRNPYHLSLPAYLMDSARRGSERVGGPGSTAESGIIFAQLYQKTILE
jgi:LmbE family N-acetylglucosaminyl deacetylase